MIDQPSETPAYPGDPSPNPVGMMAQPGETPTDPISTSMPYIVKKMLGTI